MKQQRIIIEVDVSNIEEVIQKLNTEEINKQVNLAMQESVVYIKEEVQKELPQNYRRLGERLETQIKGRGVNLTGVVVSPDILFNIVEYGRSPGAKMPPDAPIREWADNKGIVGRSAIFLIRRAIGIKGSPALMIMHKVAKSSQAKIVEIFQKHLLEGLK